WAVLRRLLGTFLQPAVPDVGRVRYRRILADDKLFARLDAGRPAASVLGADGTVLVLPRTAGNAGPPSALRLDRLLSQCGLSRPPAAGRMLAVFRAGPGLGGGIPHRLALAMASRLQPHHRAGRLSHAASSPRHPIAGADAFAGADGISRRLLARPL